MEEHTKFRLVVTSGPDAGAQLKVDSSIKLVGRALGAHLALSDRSVSRHHFHVHATRTGVYVQVCDEAAPLAQGERKILSGEVGVGESLVVGRTVLLVSVDETSRSSSAHDDATATVGSLLTGAGADVVGLAAMFALNQALTATATIEDVEAALVAWAKQHASCEQVELHAGGGEPGAAAREMPILETATPSGGTRILAPALGAPTGWLAFTTTLPPQRITDSTRRLLILAAALAGAKLADVSTLQVVRDDRDALRQLAIGSAQAFLGTSPGAEELLKIIPRLAVSQSTALFIGETGVGKTYVARLVHEAGPRKDKPFRVINCAAIPENLIESELFGHTRGAFTGATEQAGVFEAAGEGTVLLDEIGELPLASQAKLLRVLEDKQFERLGSTRSIPLRARILVATNRDLDEMAAAGAFRSDLFFRISVIKTVVPPLRDRGDDVLVLAQKILADLSSSCGRRIHDFSPEAREAIRRYPWPGNVRELRNVIEHALVMGDGPVLEVSDFPAAIRSVLERADTVPDSEHGVHVVLPMNEELLHVKNREAALQVSGGNKSRAAALLGIRRTTLYKK
ncbi:sigma 54-interacting transcriptional regulator [Pendulispora rubella]|uniref:Sigma 54-interacting transcriptional regulator n=1 Tax=Pendulispora rubella TaxID=2741070 RepID=A0ABZ2L300_9BACT